MDPDVWAGFLWLVDGLKESASAEALLEMESTVF